jgi:membrane-bound ClpP family serine protease
MALRTLPLAGAVVALQACSVFSAAGTAVGAAASVAGSAASTAVSVTGSAVRTVVDVAGSGKADPPAEAVKR